MAAAATGSAAAQYDQGTPSQRRSIDRVTTPATIVAMPSACSGRGTSPKKSAAGSTAKIGVKLLSAPDMLGPIRRLASKVSKVTTAGNNRPTTTKMTAARGSQPRQSSRNGESSQSRTPDVGMLTSAPWPGAAWRRPNCVSTSARPNTNDAPSASTMGLSSKDAPGIARRMKTTFGRACRMTGGCGM